MNRPIHLLVVVVAALALAGIGCGASLVPDAELTVIAQPLSPETTRVHFTLSGDGLVGSSMGGVGDFSNMLTFRRVPEGFKTLRAWGLQQLSPSGVHPDFPSSFFRVVEYGEIPPFSVVSTSRQNLTVPLTPSFFPDNAIAGVERYLLNANYDFEATDPNAGSPDGANITVGVIDGASPDCVDAIIGAVGDGEGAAAIGLFGALPATWGDPAGWPQQVSDLSLDGNGLAVFYAVAKPGQAGHNTLLVVSPGSVSGPLGCTLSAEIFVRNSGYATIGAIAP